MKLLVAVIKPFKVTELVDAFRQHGTSPGMTVVGAKGFGRRATGAVDADPDAATDFFEHALVLVAAPEAQVDALVELIARTAHTGRPGDGKVLVLPIEGALAITSGERGEAALG
ncbi:MAG TPA: P-II family nitrogen regulator [Gemmatimonadales bacterium]|nr:P-II family nitrogen regulator [Gemmatimonadales bacterium]